MRLAGRLLDYLLAAVTFTLSLLAETWQWQKLRHRHHQCRVVPMTDGTVCDECGRFTPWSSNARCTGCGAFL